MIVVRRNARKRRPATTVVAVVGLVLAALLAAVAPVSAQDRSDTGRRKPVELPPPVKASDELPPKRGRPGKAATWFLGGGGGVMGGGSLFRVQTITGAAVPWGTDDETLFTSERFRVRFDTNPTLGFYVGRRLGSILSVRADLGRARLDLAAEALQGQSAAVFLYDRVSVTTAGLGVEARLTSERSYPVFTAAVLMVSLDASRESELDRSGVGARVGLGYVAAVGGGRGEIRAEVRVTRTAYAADDFRPSVTREDDPEIQLEIDNALTFFEAVIAANITF